MTATPKQLHVWCPDPLEKIFRTTRKPEGAQSAVIVEAARGEVVSGQVALRTEDVKMYGFGVDAVVVEPLRLVGSRTQSAIPVERRWVGSDRTKGAAPISRRRAEVNDRVVSRV